jgi:galactokinase/mevalonate kinase-like predicted kinase
MTEFLHRLEKADKAEEVCQLIDGFLEKVRAEQSTRQERRLFLRRLVFNPALLAGLKTAQVLDHLFAHSAPEEWKRLFADAVERELPRLMVEVVDSLADVGHQELLRFVPHRSPKGLFALLKALDAYLQKQESSRRYLRGMRVARIMAEVYERLAEDPQAWKRRAPPACCIDGERLAQLKMEKKVAELASAYRARINQLQRLDLRHCLAGLGQAPGQEPRMQETDYERDFLVEAPLRLGISSANASDNHLRTKEQGGKTLNAGIDLHLEGETAPSPPLRVTARRLAEPKLVLRSLSLDFKADFEASHRGNAAAQSELFFAYRRGGDEALRLVKQALVYAGIVRQGSTNVIDDIAAFTGGGGLELKTQSKVLQGSGLGTSSILAASILKILYRLASHPYATTQGEYPGLYDQSLLLEQSLGLNSGWQDARGACGGPAAIKNFYAPPTEGLPAPERTFLTQVDEEEFTRRVMLFDTGMARPATRGLNAVLDVYLSRDRHWYGAIRQSLEIHDHMVHALGQGDYPALGKLASRYWQLRCTLDPEATNPTLQYLFEAPAIAGLTEGGLLTGAGGGGFALLIAKEGQDHELRDCLNKLRKSAAYARSRVVAYGLNRTGIQLRE